MRTMLMILTAGTAALAAPALPALALADKPPKRPAPARPQQPPAKAPAAAPAPAPACADADAAAGSVDAGRFTTALLCLVNAERRTRGLATLAAESHLGASAQKYAAALGPARRLGTRGRDGSTPQSRAGAAGYGRSGTVAEVLGRSTGTSATPANRVKDWMKTGATRRLLLARRYRDAGLGMATSGNTTTFVVDLGRR